MKQRMKNPYFWIGLLGIIFTASNINPTSITSWNILFNNFMEILNNPYMLGSVIMAIIGVVSNPTDECFKFINQKERNKK